MVTTQNVDRTKLSPMMLQYAEIKDKYPNDVVLFRVGDFFEAYFEDAVPMSSFGEVRFTARRIGSKGDKKKDLSIVEEKKYTLEEIVNSKILIPLSGVPRKSLNLYGQKLVSMGKRVVIVEQMEDPKDVPKGQLIRREVVKIMTSFEKDGDFLSEYLNNFVCIIYKEKGYGLCFADVSTGEIFLTNVDDISSLLNEIARYKPNEFILTEELATLLSSQLSKLDSNTMITVDNSAFEGSKIIEKIMSCFKIDTIDKIKYNSILELRSLYTLINYIENTQKLTFNFEILPVCYDFNNYMSIDMYSRSNLELTESLTDKTRGTLLSVLNHCKTSMGSRLLKQWLDKPLLSRVKIEQRLSSLSELVLDKDLLIDIQTSMYGILDISRIMGRLKLNRSIPRDLINLRDSLGRLPSIYSYLGKFDSSLLKELHLKMRTFEDLVYLLNSALLEDPASDIKEGLVIKPGYNKNLDTARDMIENSNKYLLELETSESEKTGIKTLKIVNKNGKCALEVTKSYYDKVPDYYRVEKALKQSTRYVTDESEKLERNLFSAIESSKAIEIDLYEELKLVVLGEAKELMELCDAISTFDALCSLAYSAIENNYVCPKLNSDGYIKIENGRHPVVEKLTNEVFVPNDTEMNLSSDNFILVTGPNMAGKSTYMRQIALITIMSHIGSFVPATFADISITDRIFTRIGASDDISSGRSTYMVEMVEVKNILDNATKKSLVLLDEVGRGTSTSDGLSIAQAISEYIYIKIGCKTLFATHYHELIALEKCLPGLKNYHMSVEKDNGSLNFIRKLERGGLSESYGIDVAQMAGLPDEVITRAWNILNEVDGKKVIPVVEDKSKLDILVAELKGVDRDNLSPVYAYRVLNDLFKIID